MESIIPTGGFQLPFQRHLSRLYNDTKKSSDFVKEPIQNEDDPEIKALYRKLRIQKDRFVSWGLEWSEPDQSAEIDESLSKAGLSEVVGSIMSTIKDTLAEAEPLWLSSKRVVEGKRVSPDTKAPLVHWDKDRFKDLIRDLTASIDTLYDLSRTRSSGLVARVTPKTASKSATHTEGESRHFESTRMQTPQQIDPMALTYLRPVRPLSRTRGPALRDIVCMGKTAYSDLMRGSPSQPWAPFLLEYAPFDPIFAATGIMPPMARFEKLSSALQQDSQRAPTTWTGLPRLFGYFEDMANSRLGLVYHLPPAFNVLPSGHSAHNPQYIFPTLADLLLQPNSEPPLEAKFRLAQNLTNTVFDMHARGIVHGNLLDSSVSFCPAKAARLAGRETGEIDVRHPLLSSFDLFPDDAAPPQNEIWRPSPPRDSHPSTADERITELYSLGMLLLSVGLWTKLENLDPSPASSETLEYTLQLLSQRCGTLFTKAIQTCWQAAESADRGDSEILLSSVQMRVSRFLEACCILDGVSGLEERLEEESPSSTGKGASEEQQTVEEPIPEGKDAAEPKTKMRLYPHVPLPPDVVEKWNAILMPQINTALRSFYRKHPESVEISLESVGPSPHQTRPTVLVVCSSVSKVRSILNKRLGELFDDTTGFALRVCRGHVIRARRQAPASAASSSTSGPSSADNFPSGSETANSGAKDASEDVEAVNPRHQERPGNGASIGAWIGDRHLPPVSFGGLVIVDNKTYGMTVHHMLDDPERDTAPPDTMRSSAVPRHLPLSERFATDASDASDDEESGFELSDDEAEDDYDDYDDDDDEPCSETNLTSDYQSDGEEDEYDEPGDIPGIEPGCGEGYLVTQPALDDVEDGFYPCAETEDEDHLDTFTLGELYASSGIRRRQVDGLVHEVDWALFEFAEGRQPDSNAIPCVVSDARQQLLSGRQRHKARSDRPQLRPTTVVPWSALPGMEVQCMARTSGLQAGKILPALTSVKIYGRTSPSHTYQVISTEPATSQEGSSSVALGIPGDSGAWIVDREQGQLCGHVLAWSQRKRVAYICPMDVLLQDIAQTLEATEVRLPGGEPLVALCNTRTHTQESGVAHDASEDENCEDDAASLVQIAGLSSTTDAGALSQLMRDVSNVNLGRGIDVHG